MESFFLNFQDIETTVEDLQIDHNTANVQIRSTESWKLSSLQRAW